MGFLWELNQASGGQALLLVFNNYHEILNVHTAEGSPNFRVSSRGRGLWLCVSAALLPSCPASVRRSWRCSSLRLNPWPLQTVERSNFQGNKNHHGNRDAVCDSWPLGRLISVERLFCDPMRIFIDSLAVRGLFLSERPLDITANMHFAKRNVMKTIPDI